MPKRRRRSSDEEESRDSDPDENQETFTEEYEEEDYALLELMDPFLPDVLARIVSRYHQYADEPCLVCRTECAADPTCHNCKICDGQWCSVCWEKEQPRFKCAAPGCNAECCGYDCKYHPIIRYSSWHCTSCEAWECGCRRYMEHCVVCRQDSMVVDDE